MFVFVETLLPEVDIGFALLRKDQNNQLIAAGAADAACHASAFYRDLDWEQ